MVLIAILICSYCNAQTSDFIVTTSQDTIYVDMINLTDFEVKTKTADKKKKYPVDDIISYYISKENKHYERITLEKKVLKAPDKYDYKRNEDLYLEDYKNTIKYKFIQRLTVGKVKLFTEVIVDGGIGSPGQPGAISIRSSGYAAPTSSISPALPGTMGAPHKTEIYYISIYDSKLELINDKAKFKLFDFSKGLELNEEVYEILKIYLYGNNDINTKLNQLFMSKPKAKEKQIIDLINEYNAWVKSIK